MQSSLQLIFIFLASVVGVRSSDNVCDLPKVVGPCKASIKRFHYDVQTGRCKRFFYGGCEGNYNNFETRQDCVTSCKKRVCTLPKLIGDGPFSRTGWFYNTDLMKCERFMFGEIQGNGNNFRTKRRCERLCNGVKVYPCKPHPGCPAPDAGMCRGLIYNVVNGVRCFPRCIYRQCKKGSCPSSTSDLPCNARCKPETDNFCPGDQLCCKGCCWDPILYPKRGDCPEDSKPRNCVLRNSECKSDSQCSGIRKCCRFSCQNFCVDPKYEHKVIMINV
ncbi:carboxypeptidase inhibitor SmCI-like [Mytilus edulis]|uniref:carboxypeptidase inhibitor SmCI-like n=1 Tax=Mytilus edulis TaxID=6550 RepID=UPI0039EEF74B